MRLGIGEAAKTDLEPFRKLAMRTLAIPIFDERCHAARTLKQFDTNGVRKGGVIWHTQGSGKSLTMVMLGRALALDKAISNPRIIIVTDRDDLDKQIKGTFKSCDMEPIRATSGAHLVELVRDKAFVQRDREIEVAARSEQHIARRHCVALGRFREVHAGELIGISGAALGQIAQLNHRHTFGRRLQSGAGGVADLN